MSLARFFARVDDAITPLLSSATDLNHFLSDKTIGLVAPPDIEEAPIHLAGLLFATNLSARIYPSLRIVGPDRVVERCVAEVRRINPICEIATGEGPATATLAWGRGLPDASTVTVIPRGWDVAIDSRIHTTLEATNPLVSLAAGAIGASEIFRQVFADFLPSGRRGPTPAGFNLLTLAGPSEALPALPPNIDIGRACLVGAGAIGQAMVYALGTISVRGVLDVIDPEEITLSNLQRYVLSGDEDVGRTKVSVVARALKGTAIQVATGQLAWDLALPGLDAVDTVCTAVDSEALRIEIQACLPRRAFNAWTQPSDIGWSRHEAFGVEPCLACLYWPTSPRPNYHQLVARSIRENELRVLAYLTHDISIDAVLNPALLPQIPDMPAPSNASEWFERSLLADVVRNFDLGEADAEAWRGRRLSDLYHDGVCGGALIRHGSSDLSRDIAVPLAHQSALAGVMLAAQLLIASCPDLTAYRHPASEARLNLLAGFPQLSARPRARTLRCICGDADFTQRFAAKWLSPVVTPSDANA